MYITFIPIQSSRILSFVINIPGYRVTSHICIYLPKCSLEAEYIEEVSKLETVIEEIEEKHPCATIYIREDANADIPSRSTRRDNIFNFFCSRMSLKYAKINHMTHHHFMGNGNSDSAIDVILKKTDAFNDEYIC